MSVSEWPSSAPTGGARTGELAGLTANRDDPILIAVAMDVYDTLSHPLALAVFVLTLFLPVLVGFLTVRRTRSQSDFFVGGRAMHRFVVALSAVSSGRSSWLVLGVSGIAYAQGASAVWAVAGYTLAELVQCLTLGPRLRVETERSPRSPSRRWPSSW